LVTAFVFFCNTYSKMYNIHLLLVKYGLFGIVLTDPTTSVTIRLKKFTGTHSVLSIQCMSHRYERTIGSFSAIADFLLLFDVLTMK